MELDFKTEDFWQKILDYLKNNKLIVKKNIKNRKSGFKDEIAEQISMDILNYLSIYQKR